MRHLMSGVAAAGSGCDGCTGRDQHRRASLRHRSLFTGSNWPLQSVCARVGRSRYRFARPGEMPTPTPRWTGPSLGDRSY